MASLKQQVSSATGLSPEQIDEMTNRLILDSKNEGDVDRFPALYNISAAFIFQFVPRPKAERLPEFAYINIYDEDKQTAVDRKASKVTSRKDMSLFGSVAEWNMAWEAGHLRPDWFSDKEGIADEIRRLKQYEGHNLYLLPKTRTTRYYAVEPLFHLLPYETLEQFGLPLIKRGTWPSIAPDQWIGELLPPDFDARLERAFAYHIWPLLSPGSGMSAFSSNDPLKLLAHNLDFWLPYAYKVAENWMSDHERCDYEDEEQRQLYENARQDLLDSDEKDDLSVERPLKGGPVWMGEAEAWSATEELVEIADSSGRLRGLIDAIKSNRVEDDFSPQWSRAKEDFERKLYHKRAKVKVVFVELEDTIPVHGPESEVHENLLWEDLLALLDPKERRIVVCLRNGVTRVGDISKLMGYKTHSPVSKALGRIRDKAGKWLS